MPQSFLSCVVVEQPVAAECELVGELERERDGLRARLTEAQAEIDRVTSRKQQVPFELVAAFSSSCVELVAAFPWLFRACVSPPSFELSLHLTAFPRVCFTAFCCLSQCPPRSSNALLWTRVE